MGTGGAKKGNYPPGTRWYEEEDLSGPQFHCRDHDRNLVILSVRQWHEHIWKGHPDMRLNLGKVEWSVVRPDLVTKAVKHPYRKCYYLLYPAGDVDMLIRTVVDINPRNQDRYGADGFIITSHHMPRPDPKEEILWSPPT